MEIDGQVVLGPMSGITTKSYRSFMHRFGTAFSVTEMTSDMGIIHGMKRTKDYCDFESDGITGVQLFGSDEENIALAAKKAIEFNPNIAFIDINMGCPVAKVVRKGAGSSLMRTPERCGSIIKAVKSAVDVPVTAKIRLGWSDGEINFREVIDELETNGADAITVHPRTRAEFYYGTPHYDMVEGLQKEMSAPLIISGNIYDLDSAVKALECTCARGVMVARGGVGNPFLITQIDTFLRTGERLMNPTVSQQVDWCFELTDAMLKEKGEDAGMRVIRQIAPKFISGCYQSRRYRNIIGANSIDLEGLTEMMNSIRKEKGHERIYSWGKHLDDVSD